MSAKAIWHTGNHEMFRDINISKADSHIRIIEKDTSFSRHLRLEQGEILPITDQYVALPERAMED